MLLLFITQVVQLFGTLWTAAHHMDWRTETSLSFTIFRNLLTHVHWDGDVIQPSHALLPPCPPTLNFSQHQGLFQWVGSSHQVIKVLELQLQHSPSNEYSGLIFFRIDWLDLLAVQGTLKSLLRHHSLKSISFLDGLTLTSIHPYMTTGKPIALTIWTFVVKERSLLSNMLSKFVIAFLPRSNGLLILWLQSLSAVILELKKIKSAIVFRNWFHDPNPCISSYLEKY